MTRMVFKSRIKHLIDHRMVSQKFCYFLGIMACPLYSQMKCFDTSQCQKTILWTWYCSRCILDKGQLFGYILIICDNRSQNEIRLSTDIFYGRMNSNILPKI